MREIVIEWFSGEKTASITAYSGSRLKNKIVKLAQEHSDVSIVENTDGSIFAHIPAEWVKIQPKRKMSPEQVEKALENLRSWKEVAT